MSIVKDFIVYNKETVQYSTEQYITECSRFTVLIAKKMLYGTFYVLCILRTLNIRKTSISQRFDIPEKNRQKS
jgi:hypothetical protein